MKNILVATDLSARSDRAVLRAIKLAKKFGAKLTIMNVIDSQVPRSIIEENKNLALKEIKACIKGRTKDIHFDINITVGSPHVEILKAAYEENVDLIVIGLHRHAEDKQPIIGNVIERLAKSSHKSLLVVKDRSENDYKKALVALDLNNDSKESLKRALKFFSDCKFDILHTYLLPFLGIMGQKNIEQDFVAGILDELNAIVEEVTKELNMSAAEIEKIAKEGYITNVLQKEVPYRKPDLLVFGIHGRSSFSRSLMPSASETILVDPPCDVFLASKN